VRAAIRDVLNKAKEEAQESASVAMMLGWGTEPGSHLSAEDVETAKHLAELMKSDEALEKVIREIGRMMGVARQAELDDASTLGQEICDVTQGSNLAKVMPSELMFLADPDLEEAFLRKMSAGELLQYEMKPPELPAERGDAVFLVDVSGSMMLADNISFAKGFAVAAASKVESDGRKAWIGLFDTELMLFERFNSSTATDVLLCTVHGGTDYDKTLKEVQEKDLDLSGADLVLVTDGYCEIADAGVIEWLNRSFGRIFVVLLPPGETSGFNIDLDVLVTNLRSTEDDAGVVGTFKELLWR